MDSAFARSRSTFPSLFHSRCEVSDSAVVNSQDCSSAKYVATCERRLPVGQADAGSLQAPGIALPSS
eukprot:scaffold996_cov101-Isochrysis_galbana.AAC.1